MDVYKKWTMGRVEKRAFPMPAGNSAPEGKVQSNTRCRGQQHPDLKLFTRKEYSHQLRKESTIGIPVSDERSNVFVCVVSTEE